MFVCVSALGRRHHIIAQREKERERERDNANNRSRDLVSCVYDNENFKQSREYYTPPSLPPSPPSLTYLLMPFTRLMDSLYLKCLYDVREEEEEEEDGE